MSDEFMLQSSEILKGWNDQDRRGLCKNHSCIMHSLALSLSASTCMERSLAILDAPLLSGI